MRRPTFLLLNVFHFHYGNSVAIARETDVSYKMLQLITKSQICSGPRFLKGTHFKKNEENKS